MRRTRHVVLPVRSWQYIGLLLVSLACVTFGLVARDREGQAGSLTGPELLHRAPHDVDVCPNLNIFAKSSVCLDLPEKQNFNLETNKRKDDSTDVVRIDKKSTEKGINRNELPEKKHRTINERRISERSSYPMKKFSRSLERINSKIENVGLSYRNSPNSERIQDPINNRRYLSNRYSNDRSQSTEHHEKHKNEPKTKQRNLENRKLKERRYRFEIDTRRMVDSRSIERKEARGQNKEKMEDRTMKQNRNNVRERIQDRGSKSVEQRKFRIDDSERRLMKEQRINEHRNFRNNISDRQSKLGTELETFNRGRQLNIDALNRERRFRVNTERRSSRVDNLNRQRRSSLRLEGRNSQLDTDNSERQSDKDVEQRNSRLDNLNRERRSSLSIERRNSRLDTVNRERQSNEDVERRNSRLDALNLERRLSEDVERRNSRLDILNRERRLSVDAERRNSRLDNLYRQRRSSLSTGRRNPQLYSVNREHQSNEDVERRNSRLDALNLERLLSEDVERRNSRLDNLNRERRLSVDAERRNSRLNTSNRERRLSVDAERKNSRLDNLNRKRRSSLSTERRNSRLDTVNRERQSNEDVERRNSQLDNLDRQRRSSLRIERTNSRHDTINRERQSNEDAERRNSRLNNLNRQRRSSLSIERRNSRLDTVNRERQSNEDIERRNSRLDALSLERRLSEDVERRNSRLDNLNRERRLSVDAERRNSRLDNLNRKRRSSLSIERRNSRLDTVNRERQSNEDVERRNSRLDALNLERRLSEDVERRNSRLDNLNRERRLSVDAERRNSRLGNLNRKRRSSLSIERRNSRLDTVNRERQSNEDVERRNSRLDALNLERRLSEDVERRNSRLDNLNRERRLSVDAERRNSRLDNLYRKRKSCLSIERRNSRLDTVNRERQSNEDIERRYSRLDALNLERRLSEDVERRNSRLDNLNRERRLSVDAERRNSRLDNLNRQRRSSLSIERRNSRLDTVNRESQYNEDVERRYSRLDALNVERRLSGDVERRNSRLDNLNRQRRSSLSTGRRNSQLYTVNRQSNENVERINSRLDALNRERRMSIDIVRKNSRLGTLNHERRFSSMADRTSTRLTRGNRRDSESFYLNSLRTKFSSPDNTSADQENIRSQIRNIRFNLIERKQSGVRLEDQRFGRRMLDLEDRKLLDRHSRSIEQRNINAINRDTTYLGLRRKISNVRNFEYINHHDNIKRDLINRLSRSLFTKRDSRGQIVHSKADRSSESIDHHEKRKIFLNREIIKTPKQNSYEFTALKRIVRSLNAKNLRNTLHTARYSFNSSLQLDHTRIKRNSFSNERLNERSSRGQIADEISLLERKLTQNRQHRIARIFTSEISNRKSFIIRKYHISKQAERLSRSLDNINRLNSNERLESAENRRFRTRNDHSYSVLSTERQDIQQQRENLPRTSILVLTNNSEERRRLNTRIQERSNGRVEKMMNEKRRSSNSRLIGKEERLMVLRSRDHHRDIRLDLKKRHNDLQIRYIDSLTRRENSDFDKTSKLIERSRSNTDKRSLYRKLIDLRQSNSEKIRTSETSTQHRNTLLIPMIDHNRSNVAKNKENTKQFFDTNHKIPKIFKEFRSEEYGGKIGMISNLLKTNVLLDYNLSFEIIRQPFMIIICILYGSSMTKNNKLFMGNLMEGITKLVLR
ncbi:uncharacterized protein PF11_0213-like [Polistes fuscatus]|uniref:uncharacterized protein PF11_0213-like n=1 Tax=Polistes fuscatus TaxID=30207 RepID=UPI001CA851D2|nr:uncharacterized protein PF11_0213-like [Polistes fuscatus]